MTNDQENELRYLQDRYRRLGTDEAWNDLIRFLRSVDKQKDNRRLNKDGSHRRKRPSYRLNGRQHFKFGRVF